MKQVRHLYSPKTCIVWGCELIILAAWKAASAVLYFFFGVTTPLSVVEQTGELFICNLVLNYKYKKKIWEYQIFCKVYFYLNLTLRFSLLETFRGGHDESQNQLFLCEPESTQKDYRYVLLLQPAIP